MGRTCCHSSSACGRRATISAASSWRRWWPRCSRRWSGISASAAAGPIGRTTRRGSNSAMGWRCAGWSATTATAHAPPSQSLQQLYALLRLQLNVFRPVRKLLSKQRVGSKVVNRYDAPQTPYQRALAQPLLALDPVALAHDIQRTLDTLWKLADTRRTGAEVAHG